MWYRLCTDSTMTLKDLLSRCRAFDYGEQSEKGLTNQSFGEGNGQVISGQDNL